MESIPEETGETVDAENGGESGVGGGQAPAPPSQTTGAGSAGAAGGGQAAAPVLVPPGPPPGPPPPLPDPPRIGEVRSARPDNLERAQMSQLRALAAAERVLEAQQNAPPPLTRVEIPMAPQSSEASGTAQRSDGVDGLLNFPTLFPLPSGSQVTRDEFEAYSSRGEFEDYFIRGGRVNS